MVYVRHIPSPPLNSLVSAVIYCGDLLFYPREKILPSPFPDLKVNFGGDFPAYKADHAEPFVICSDSWCVGSWSTYHIVDWPPDVRFFMVEFKPGGAYPFLGVPLSELHNQVVSLDMIWGGYAAEVRERLDAAPTIAMGLSLLEQLLLARLNDLPSGLRTIQYAVGEIARQHGVVSVRALSDDIGISQKHLISQFKRMVGATPKELARMYRLQHVLGCIDPAQPIRWTEVAHQCFYYDQSHFNKEFEAFTGHSPNAYLQIRRRINAENPQRALSLRQLPTG